MEEHLQVKKRDDRKSIRGCQGKPRVAIYKAKRSQKKSASGADDFCVAQLKEDRVMELET